jgi:hypothetical protein
MSLPRDIVVCGVLVSEVNMNMTVDWGSGRTGVGRGSEAVLRLARACGGTLL